MRVYVYVFVMLLVVLLAWCAAERDRRMDEAFVLSCVRVW